MKVPLISIGVVAALLSGCSPKSKVKTEIGGENILIEWIKLEKLLDEFPLYKDGLVNYHPDSLAVEKIKAFKENLQILIFIGTWCPDSKREVPRLLKTLQLAANPKITMKIYGLDRTKKDKAGLTAKYNILYVPTFIFLFEGKDIGRIVERPEISVEQDFVRILETNKNLFRELPFH